MRSVFGAFLMYATAAIASEAVDYPPASVIEKRAVTRAERHRIVVTHGLVMALAFAVFFPLGAIVIRLFSFKGLMWIHAGWQIFAWILALAGLGLGVWIATTTHQWTASNGHPIIGTLVIGLLVLQPILAIIHHQIYKREHKRTVWIYGHIWYGRILLILGAINGGLGLQLSGNTVKGEIAYGVIVGVMFVLWFAVVLFRVFKPKRTVEEERGEKYQLSNSPTESQDGVTA
ncbi:MAG: hypothetical protein M1812_003309 [Candelaria pacifica]|nr:MAG: hypothetical protein M1812_003309 [Candelaria pacifica]